MKNLITKHIEAHINSLKVHLKQQHYKQPLIHCARPKNELTPT